MYHDEIAFEVCFQQTLQREATVSTMDYRRRVVEDEDGVSEEINTDDTDWNEVLMDNGIHSPLRLIEILKEVLESGAIYINKRETKNLIKECKEWTSVETHIEEA